MEFQYSEYIVRITLNPVDIIVRFEHTTNFRAYEQTFFERDFPEAALLGGLEFLGKALISAFQQEKAGGEVTIEDFKKSNTTVSFNLTINNPLFVSAIMFPIELHALRKESGNVDVSVLNRKVKEMSDGFEPRLLKLQQALETRLATLDTLTSKLKEMEERCGDVITLPGCEYAIPTTLNTLTLVRNNTGLPNGEYVSGLMPQMKCNPKNTSNQSVSFNQDYPFQNHQHGYANTWAPAVGYYPHNGIHNLKNLKYMRSCTQLVVSGTSELRDYSPIGEMPHLTHLTIVSSRSINPHSNPIQYPNQGNNPILTDIKWVKNLKNLQSLTLLGCSSLSDITPLKDLPNLRELDIRETAVRNTDFLINPNLKITK
jgi:hypothetical protein